MRRQVWYLKLNFTHCTSYTASCCGHIFLFPVFFRHIIGVKEYCGRARPPLIKLQSSGPSPKIVLRFCTLTICSFPSSTRPITHGWAPYLWLQMERRERHSPSQPTKISCLISAFQLRLVKQNNTHKVAQYINTAGTKRRAPVSESIQKHWCVPQ